ncbi:MAG: type II secretion system F family protein, partial [Candidatus Paceibacteria bacterium]
MAEIPQKRKKIRKSFYFGLRRVSLTDKMFFARYLALMLRSGVPITRGLELLYVQVENQHLKVAISSIAKDITAGVSVADSLAKFPDIFNELFVNMVRSGEAGGNLEEVLDILAEELRKSAELRSKVIGALIYPSIIIAAMIAVSLFIVFFVFPRIIQVYESLNVQVPLLTRILIAVVRFSTANVKYFVAGLFLFLVAIMVAIRTRSGKRAFDKLLLKLPIFKTIIRKVNTVQFTRTLSSLLRSGLPTPQALEITSRTLRNVLYSESVSQMANGVRQGKRISEIITAIPGAIYP